MTRIDRDLCLNKNRENPFASALRIRTKTVKTSFTQFVMLVSTIVAKYFLPAGEQAPRQSVKPLQQA
jgi:hypothetical protein